MPSFNFWLLLATGLIPLAVGFVWYNPKVFGSAWMQATGMTEEKAKQANMPLIFGLTYLFGVMISFGLSNIVIHQFGFFQSIMTPEFENGSPELVEYAKDYYARFGTNFRSFGHGALHGIIAGIAIALPLIGVNALFEGRNGKYIAINVGYWVVTMALIGGVLCQFM